MDGLLVTPAFAKAVRSHDLRLNGEPLNRPQPRGRYPVIGGGKGVKFFRLTGSTYIHRGSHPNGVEAEEVRVSSIDHGRVTWQLVRKIEHLYCGSNGVYVQRDSGLIGNDPGDPGGGRPEDPPPCPPYCEFTGNSGIATAAATAQSWRFLGSASRATTAGAFSSAAGGFASVYAVTGLNQNGYDFTIGQWESVFIGVAAEDITGGYGNVSIDGIGTVPAFMLCTDDISDGSSVQVIYRELGGIGGFAIIGPICCPGYGV